MPVYEYQCHACHKEFEYQQRMADPEKEVCEACGGKLERLISRTAFSLKGGGWYKDLYASSKPEKPASGGSDKPASSSDGSSSGGDSTPAAAPAAAAPAAAPSTPSSSGSSSGSGGGGTT